MIRLFTARESYYKYRDEVVSYIWLAAGVGAFAWCLIDSWMDQGKFADDMLRTNAIFQTRKVCLSNWNLRIVKT